MSTSAKILVLLVILCGASRTASAEINLKQLRKQYVNAGVEDRLAIVKKMASIAKDVEPAVRILEEGLSDADERIRIEVISALRTIGPSAGHAVYYVTLLLEDPTQNNELRLQYIRFLGEIGSQSSGSEIALAKIVSYDPDIKLRRAAATALGAIHVW